MLRTLFVLGIVVGGLPFAVYSPFYALLLYLWYALFRPEAFVWFDLTPYRVSLLLGILLVVRSAFAGVYPNLSHPLTIGSLAFLLLACAGQVGAVDPSLGWLWLDYQARVICVSLLAVSLIDTRQKLFLAVAVVATSFGFHSAKAGLASLLGGGVQFADGLAGSFNDNNGYALGIAMILPLLVATAQNAPYAWMRIGYYLSAPLSAFTVVSLFSRGGLLGVAGAAVALAAMQRRPIRALAIVAAVAIGGYYYAPIPQGWFERIETIQTYDEVEDRSALGRLHFWRVAVEMAKDRPLGVGLKNYEAAYNSYDFSGGLYGFNRAVHSSHFQVLAETGFAGAFLWVTLFCVAFVLVVRIRRRARDPRLAAGDARFLLTMANGLAASMLGFLVGGSFLSAAHNDVTWLTFGLLASLDRLSRRLCAEAAEEPARTEGAPLAPSAERPLAPVFTFSPRR
ncbi:MAG TPA: putative O-glycosylation ligase, exosortase A system-associated [Vicinamibacterales bacterium]|nr:putative O-glycosylation ligase, exosortase A system-associated [Vicinamibacterales bacterium]